MKINVPFSLDIIVEYPHLIEWGSISVKDITGVPKNLILDNLNELSMSQLFIVYDFYLNIPGTPEDCLEQMYEILINNILESKKVFGSELSGAYQHTISRGSVLLIKHMMKFISNVPHYMSLNVKLTNKLIQAGADVNQVYKDNNSRTALMNCANKGTTAVMKLLIKHGADVNQIDDNGNSSLAYALNSNRYSIACDLLANKADPNILINFRNGLKTPMLCFAIAFNNADFIDLLLKFKADPFKTDKNGNNAFYYAELKGDKFISSLLTSR